MAKASERTVVCKGVKLAVVYGRRNDGSCPARDFLEALESADRAKFYSLFQRFADHGLIQDGTKFKRLDGDVWEFKVRGHHIGLRVTCYRNARLCILLTGFQKNEDEAPPREVTLATTVMTEDRGRFPDTGHGRR